MGLLAGKRIIVVEDDTLIVLAIEEILIIEGAAVVSSHSRVADALKSAQSEFFDAGVLDVDLSGETSFPVAEVLQQQGVPFLFISGYDERDLANLGSSWPLLNKPFRGKELVARLALMCGDDSPSA